MNTLLYLWHFFVGAGAGCWVMGDGDLGTLGPGDFGSQKS